MIGLAGTPSKPSINPLLLLDRDSNLYRDWDGPQYKSDKLSKEERNSMRISGQVDESASNRESLSLADGDGYHPNLNGTCSVVEHQSADKANSLAKHTVAGDPGSNPGRFPRRRVTSFLHLVCWHRNSSHQRWLRCSRDERGESQFPSLSPTVSDPFSLKGTTLDYPLGGGLNFLLVVPPFYHQAEGTVIHGFQPQGGAANPVTQNHLVNFGSLGTPYHPILR